MKLLFILACIAIFLTILLLVVIFFPTKPKSENKPSSNDDNTPVEVESTFDPSVYPSLLVKKKGFFARFFDKEEKRNRLASKTIKIALNKMHKGEVQQAKVILEQLLNTFPEKIEILVKLANIAMDEGNSDLALEYYMKLLKQSPNHIGMVLTFAKIYYNAKQYDKALEILERIDELYPNNEDIKFNIVKCKTGMIDFDDETLIETLKTEFATMSKKFESSPVYSYLLASFYAKIGDIDNAYEYCCQSIKESPQNFETNKLYGLLLLVKQDYQNAKKHLNYALKYNNYDAEVQDLISYIVCQPANREDLAVCRKRYYEVVQKMFKNKC